MSEKAAGSRSIAATHLDAIQGQDMEVDIHVQRTTKTLNQCYAPGRAILKRISSSIQAFTDPVNLITPRDCSGCCAVSEYKGQNHGHRLAVWQAFRPASIPSGLIRHIDACAVEVLQTQL